MTSPALASRVYVKANRRQINVSIWNYVYLIPAVAMVLVFVYYALLFNAEVSLHRWDGISPERRFIGFANYREMLADRAFGLAVKNTLIWTATTTLALTVLGFFLAALMTAAVQGKALISIIIIFPSISATVVASTIARQMFGADGEVNQLLAFVGLGSLARPWLADPSTALYTLIIVHVWQWTGFSFLLYYSALTLVNQETVEAAYLDGANFRQIIWRVLFPMCRPTTYALVTLGVINSLKTFDIVYLTTAGGPGRSTETVSTFLFDAALLDGRAGYSAALSVVLVVVSLGSTLALLWFQRRTLSDA